MSVYVLLNLAVAGILAGAALIAVGVILVGRALAALEESKRLVAAAEAKKLAADEAMWDSIHTYWAALDAARKTGARS